MQLGSMFICNCNVALQVSDTFCVHLQEHLETVEAASGDMLQDIKLYILQQVTHQRLLLQFLSAPEDGCKKRPKHVELHCSY